MKVLLLSMPDSFEHMPPVGIRMPNGALTSLAGNVDPRHRVAVADLILVQRRVRETVTGLVRELDPEVVGLSIMTSQRRTAARLIELIRVLRPGVKRLPLRKFVLDGCHEQAARPAHYSPVVFVSRSARQTDLIMTTVVVDARPREAVRATLPEKQLQEFHELT
jgi:hypothetical protein